MTSQLKTIQQISIFKLFINWALSGVFELR
ncbi:MAG: hypothetical protein RI965_700 [Bacteroidota bacterium]|jgi:hypothetical protein